MAQFECHQTGWAKKLELVGGEEVVLLNFKI